MARKLDKPKARPFHHGDLRNTLLGIARRLVARHGPEGFSLREAAREAGVSPNAAYRHFADRQALLKELARQGFLELAIEMEQGMAAAGDEPNARLAANGEAYVRFAAREPDLFALMFTPFGAGDGGRAEITAPGPATGLDAFQLLGSALDGMVAGGRLSAADRRGAEQLLWPTVHGLAMLTNAGALPPPVEKAFRRVYPMMARAIGVTPPHAPWPAAPAQSVRRASAAPSARARSLP